MKSKNIPHDIKKKTIKEAQKEIEELLTKLENPQINLEESVDNYNRMIHLNQHIQEQFKKRAEQIKLNNNIKDIK